MCKAFSLFVVAGYHDLGAVLQALVYQAFSLIFFAWLRFEEQSSGSIPHQQASGL
jgi:hypothetical protein